MRKFRAGFELLKRREVSFNKIGIKIKTSNSVEKNEGKRKKIENQKN